MGRGGCGGRGRVMWSVEEMGRGQTDRKMEERVDYDKKTPQHCWRLEENR